MYRSNAGGMLPVRWTSPEALHQGVFNEASDVWAFGITCIEIFQDGERPYGGVQTHDLVQDLTAGYRHPRPRQCPELLYDEIIAPCWAMNPGQRATFSDISSWLGCLTPGYTAAAENDGPGLQAVPSAAWMRMSSAVPRASAPIEATGDDGPGREQSSRTAAARFAGASSGAGRDHPRNTESFGGPAATGSVARPPDEPTAAGADDEGANAYEYTADFFDRQSSCDGSKLIWYASWAVQSHPNGGQYDFARSPARTPGVRVDELAKSRKIPTRKFLPPFCVSRPTLRRQQSSLPAAMQNDGNDGNDVTRRLPTVIEPEVRPGRMRPSHLDDDYLCPIDNSSAMMPALTTEAWADEENNQASRRHADDKLHSMGMFPDVSWR